MNTNKSPILSDGEWKIMHKLWEKAPRTLMELVNALFDETKWSKGTVSTLLSRMTEKGAVRAETSGRNKLFYPILSKNDAEMQETGHFLSKVYEGSVGMMISAMAGTGNLKKEDVDELYAILDGIRKE